MRKTNLTTTFKKSIAINVSTEKEDKALREALHSHGRQWSSGDSYLDVTYFKDYQYDNSMVYLVRSNRKASISCARLFGYDVREFKNIDLTK